MSTLELTPKGGFQVRSMFSISDCVIPNRVSISRLEILRERADEREARKIDAIASNIREINSELLEMTGELGKRWDQPQPPLGEPKDTADLDRKTKTESLIVFTWAPLMKCPRFLERAKGNMRNLRARAREEKQTDEVIDLENDMEKLTQIQIKLRDKEKAIKELELDDQSTNPRPVKNVFNEKSSESYYLNFNKDEIFKALIACEGHFRNFTSLKEDEKGFLNCIVKHLADAEGHCDEAISHALIAENEETSRGFLELRDKIRDLRRYIQSSPITRDEGIREIRKIRRSFEAFNSDYDVSKCEMCGDPSEVMEEMSKILNELKKTPLTVAAHEPEADEFIMMEREMAEKLIAKLSEKYGVEPPKIEIIEKCHEPSAATYSEGHIYVCRSGVNLHVLAHEFWHHVQKEKGKHMDEGEAEKFAVDLFEAPHQKGLYANHNHSHNDRKMVKSIKDVGIIYGLQQLGFAADYGLKYADTLRPEGILGQPISLWGDLIGAIGGVVGALYLSAPYDLVAAMVGGYLSTDLWNHLARLVPMRVARPPPLTYTPPSTVVKPISTPSVAPPIGRYQITA